jgi:hypothetical protein
LPRRKRKDAADFFSGELKIAEFKRRYSVRKFSVVMLISMCTLSLLAGTSLATAINPYGEWSSSAESSLQGVLNSITVGGTSSVDAAGPDNHALADGSDSIWSITGTESSLATLIIEVAGWANVNTFGIWDAYDPSKKVELFSGVAAAGSTAKLSILADGSVEMNLTDTGVDFAGNSFGYYLTNGSNQTFYSLTSLNDDQFDHMVAFRGTDTDKIQLPDLSAGLWTNNEYVLAWEDIYGGGDWDYQDMVLMVESVQPAPVPEPATMLLLGSGLVGLAGYRKLRKRYPV